MEVASSIMAELSFECPTCGAGYQLPETYRQAITGRAVFCVGCERWWVAVADPSGAPVRLAQGRPERAPVDLRPFRRDAGAAPVQAPPAAAAPAPTAPSAPVSPAPSAPAPPPAASPELGATARVPLQARTGQKPSLRVVVSAPGNELKGVFDLGTKSFLIGKEGCHLKLQKADIPRRAIRIRAAGAGFGFEGIDGFAIPIGSVSVVSGRIEPGGSVRMSLAPYEILLETSGTPGRPIADLDRPAPAPPAPAPPAPVAPAPAPPAPVAPPAPAAPPPPSPGPPGATDLRAQLQDFAIDVRPDQSAFSEQVQSVQAALDGDETITDLGAHGFQASRFGNPLAGLDVSLVRADGPTKGQTFKVTKSPLVIGRKEGDMIIRDGRVSSKHAQLDISGPRIYTLKDLASTNGTTVNDKPVSVGHLQHGDVVSFGGVKFEFNARQTV